MSCGGWYGGVKHSSRRVGVVCHCLESAKKVEKCVTYLGAFGGQLTRKWALLNASISIYLQYASVLWCDIDIVIHINYNNTYFVSTIMIWVYYMDYLYSIVYPTQKIN